MGEVGCVRPRNELEWVVYFSSVFQSQGGRSIKQANTKRGGTFFVNMYFITC